ncbi:hypothetical protein [uncultured Mediterranean phage uvMED]|nr:hypothetical protein [uncultured Mediterranean phage uvMED]
MGGAAGAGGSDRSDEKKVDTYADQLKTIQKKKSPFKTDKDGNLKRKNIIDRYVENHPVIQTVKNVGDKLNLNRRMKFANKNNINLQGLSTEEILSKDFKSKLDEKGYTKEPGNVGGNDDRGNNTTILSTAPVRNVAAEAPTTMEVSQAQSTDSTEYSASEKKIQTNKKGRKDNLLTSAQGLGKNNLIIKKNKLGAA